MKPINKIPRLIRIATAVIVAGGLAVMVLLAQDDLDTVRQAAEQGDATAQFNLGIMYANGRGVLKDDAEAVEWYRLAAEQGYADAQFNLGGMYANGEGVPKDDAEALRWYRLAADQGQAAAQYNLGVRYAFGQGALKDGRSREMVSAGRRSGPTRRAVQSRVHVLRGARCPQGRCRIHKMVSARCRAGSRQCAA